MMLEGFLIFCVFLTMIVLVLYFTCNLEDDDENDVEVLLLD